MLKACNLKKGNIIQINNKPHQVKTIVVHTPSARGSNTLYKVRFSSIPEGQKHEETYKGNDLLEEMEFEKRPSSYIFKDRDIYTFMDLETYDQYALASESLCDQVEWLVEGMEGITSLLLDGQILCIELPSSINLEIVETDPIMKGATATNRNKPAKLSNGVTVMVPDYLEAGDVIQVNTETGKFMSRTKA